MLIAIGGLTASGKSSLATALSTELQWQNISAGTYYRAIAEERNMSIFELSTIAVHSPDIDNHVTNEVLRNIKQHENCILDAHAACFIAYGLDHVSVFLYCPLEERARRLTQRTKLTLEEALNKIETLDRETTLRMYRLYKQDFMNLSSYHLVINTAKTDLSTCMTVTRCLVEQILRSHK